ncbi:MAG: DUF167 domain-containing protein [Leptospiraceae bacterium]|nr:DUF167 domain-containing protein [Leptospiraceae bacterium]
MKLEVIVKPNSKSPGIEITEDSKWIVKVRERAIEGQANEAVIQAISEKIKVPKSRIQLIRGEKSKLKIFSIEEKS